MPYRRRFRFLWLACEIAFLHLRSVDSSGHRQRASLLVLVPGLGQTARVGTAIDNIAWLRKQSLTNKFECVLYVYVPRVDLNLSKSDFAPCRIVYRPGTWAMSMKRVSAKVLRRSEWVLVWLADSAVPSPSVHINSMLHLMSDACNRLDVLSLSYEAGAPHGPHKVMQQNLAEPVGRLTTFFEFNFALMSAWSFRCLQQVSDLWINHSGIGLDLIFPRACGVMRLKNRSLRIGVLDSMTMVDIADNSYDKRVAGRQLEALVDKWYITPPKLQTISSLQPCSYESSVDD